MQSVSSSTAPQEMLGIFTINMDSGRPPPLQAPADLLLADVALIAVVSESQRSRSRDEAPGIGDPSGFQGGGGRRAAAVRGGRGVWQDRREEDRTGGVTRPTRLELVPPGTSPCR